MNTTLTTTQCEALESLLADLEAHARASTLLADEHRQAIAASDTPAIARCVAAQQESASQLMALETRRVNLLKAMGLRSTSATTLTQLAQLAPPAKAAILAATVARVKNLLAEAAQRRETVRLASLSLMSHMQGLLSQIGRHLSDSKTYGHPTRTTQHTTAGTLDFIT